MTAAPEDEIHGAVRHSRRAMLAVAGAMYCTMATAQPAGTVKATAAAASGAAAQGKAGGPPTSYVPERGAIAERHYKIVWGIDTLRVKTAESGQMIRFSWRVLDPQRAAVLNDKKIEPALIDQSAGVSLVVPQMENIGQLRQVAPPQAGKSYWMAFSNKGRLVKPGDRVSVVIGPFRAEGLVVD